MKSRIFLFNLILVILPGILVLRLFQLTVLEGEHRRELSDGQRIKVQKIGAPRGIIFDRKGRALVKNVPVYELPDKDGELKEISHEEALRLETSGEDSDLVVNVGREYPYSESMAHLLGYLGQATEEEVGNGTVEAGKLIGRMGIEAQYNELLTGVDGGELIEVDTYGRVIRKIGKKDSIPGQNVFLSVDADLQKVAYEALRGKKGALVAQDKSGQVLALVSSPSFDPNIFTKGGKVEEILNNSNYPLFNRVIAGMYPPGSTFKIVTSAAGLEENKITTQTIIDDPGQIVIGQYHFGNWYFSRYGKTEGAINVVRAFARSTDTFFYKVGELVGAKKLVEWAQKFGLAKKTEIDLPGEVSGFLPDPTNNWFLGNTYHLSIGQGNIGLTPLQVNRLAGAAANEGKLCVPRVREGKGESRCVEVGMKTETIGVIREGMKAACSPGGTAGIFFDFVPQIGCKTGTAEFDDPGGKTHAWFTAFAPFDQPEIVVTVVVEGGGEGSSIAAPIVKEILKEYFKK